MSYTPKAFPLVIDDDTAEVEPGMTLRDYFAAKAMQAGLAPDPTGSEWRSPEDMAEWAYRTADAMLEARKEASR